VQQFLQIVVHYLDFKQKEKFNRLKKLRRSQANLPVAQYKDQIIDAVRNEQVVILAGDTGCGKSTQVPQYLFQAGFDGIGELSIARRFDDVLLILLLSTVCTQPRRIACISLAKRVSHEMLCEYGTEVGYQIRFERSKSLKTKILFVTEGLLLRQVSNFKPRQCSTTLMELSHLKYLSNDFYKADEKASFCIE
jgi:ATP-dependent RNA helicase DHX34